ncbi:MAG: osmoprotectant transport system ATP-binding protein [Planctomycetota bacterium]|jgi:osmoprotectant transport system ATP-binding protein
MIEFEHAGVTYAEGGDGRAVVAVRDLNLSVEKGETVCLIGPSGSGKTSTLRLVNRMTELSSGRVLVEGEDNLVGDPIRLRRRIGYVIQSGGLFPHMTVRQNVGILCGLEEWSASATRERVDELLELVRLDPKEFGDRLPSQLSGGQRQRVGVARSLALDPAILLMDEPFSALDPMTRSDLQNEFLELCRTVGKTILLVTHNLREAFLLGDRVALLIDGELACVGTQAELSANPGSPEVARYLELEDAAQ